MTDEEIKNKAKETSGGNYYYEQGFIYGFELGEENGRKELEKENAKLKQQAESDQLALNESKEIIAELKAEKKQIQEQVKKILLDENAEIGDIKKLVGMDWYDVKEIEQLKYNLKCRDDELAESKAQVEKMKCCENCNESCYDFPIVRVSECLSNNYSLWELIK